MPKTRRQKLKADAEDESASPPIKPPKKATIKKIPLNKSQLRQKLIQKLKTQKKFSAQEQRHNHEEVNKKLRQILPIEKLNCSICLQTLICPTLTQCGHSFCLPCAEEAIRYKPTCSFCRSTLEFDQFQVSSVLNNLVENKINQSQTELLESYNRRLAQFKELDQKCRICDSIDVGEMVDFWYERRWREGKIVQTKLVNNKKIHKIESTPHWSSDRTQQTEVEASSRLLARHRSFTKEEDVRPRSRLGQFRVEIMNIRQSDVLFEQWQDPPLLFELMRNHRNEEGGIRVNERSQSSIIRIALSIERRYPQ